MSLTSQDLQAIGDLIEQKLDQKLDQRFDEFEQKLDQKFEEKFEQKFEQKFKPIRRDMRKIKKTLDEAISFFDREIIDHNHRLDRLENHTGLAKFVSPV